MKSYTWIPTGETTRTIKITQPGQISLHTADSNGCIASAGPITYTQADTFTTVTQTGNSVICEGDTVYLSTNQSNASSYSWQPGNITSSTLPVTTSGQYSLTTKDTSGCEARSDTFNITVQPNNLDVQMISNDTTICAGSTITLTAQASNDSVYWYSPMNQPDIYLGNNYESQINQTTTFYIQVESTLCASSYDSITVTTEDCKNPIIPNVFTPNGDGYNDYFQITILDVTCFNVKIYNRWGILIYMLESPEQYWDGRIYNSPEYAADGVYYYILDYCTLGGEDVRKNGHVSIRR
jgi:gliding motility-associated-like protein